MSREEGGKFLFQMLGGDTVQRESIPDSERRLAVIIRLITSFDVTHLIVLHEAVTLLYLDQFVKEEELAAALEAEEEEQCLPV